MSSVSVNDNEKSPPRKRARPSKPQKSQDEPEIVLSLRRLDPVVQFLTRATGKPTIPISTLQTALPGAPSQNQIMLAHIPELVQRGVLHLVSEDGSCPPDLSSLDDPKIQIGFPPPPSLSDTVEKAQVKRTSGTLHGCTKASAKRRLAALNRSLKETPLLKECSLERTLQSQACPKDDLNNAASIPKHTDNEQGLSTPRKEWLSHPAEEVVDEFPSEEILEEERTALQALESLLGFIPERKKSPGGTILKKDPLTHILPKQASYAGSNAERSSCYQSLHKDVVAKIPSALMDAYGLERDGMRGRRRLYKHQAAAIESAMRGIHTLVCTGTGSGKSLCFLLPVLASAMTSQRCSFLLMFPTKALAQDQMSKLEDLIRTNPALQKLVRLGVIDGDTSHANRAEIAKSCNVILTNPDTLHHAILPGWKKVYRPLLERLKYVVIDEMHMYDGVFGAHVALVLSRMMRLCAVCSSRNESESRDSHVMLPSFLACSATMTHPEHHFRQLCPIAGDAPLTVLTADDDGSPRSAKHFFVWNPPIMDVNGMSTGKLTLPRPQKAVASLSDKTPVTRNKLSQRISENGGISASTNNPRNETQYRRHAADETALLLAKAVANNVRCIAFCKTRCLVEWVYERTVSTLRSHPSTEHLASRVESYRGGYTVEARRLIEQRLFKNELLGVVGTSALELGVDIGGIDITFHCGYPSSYSSLLQQAGRAGRGISRLDVPSLSIMICFNSPSEQQIWRHPKNLLSCGLSIPTAASLNVGLVEGHILCAGEEYPLTGRLSVKNLYGSDGVSHRNDVMSDYDLFGSEAVYCEALEALASAGSLVKETVSVTHAECKQMALYKTHPSVRNPWTRVSLRSIEPINYSIVDASHVLQRGRMDAVLDERAVLDTIPYSRVFYHAFPGAIIMHRGRKYKVLSMTRPPPFAACGTGYGGKCSLAAFAKPTTVRYSTRPLSTMKITIVKQMERIDSKSVEVAGSVPTTPQASAGCDYNSLAGNGVVTVKRSVHGYKKLSPVTRAEIARTEISLPSMEFDTYALWIDTEAATLAPVVSDYDAGVHALSHALLAVASLFVPCASSDLECDHKYIECTRIMLFDLRAGGTGICAQLWKCVFKPNGLLDAAIDLLENCPSCSSDSDYDGGCPACLQSGHCIKFNQNLSRTAGLIIAKRMLNRVKQTALYKQNCAAVGRNDDKQNDESMSESDIGSKKQKSMTLSSPRRAKRATALRDAKHLKSARGRQIVVGRPSWPLDEVDRAHQETADWLET